MCLKTSFFLVFLCHHVTRVVSINTLDETAVSLNSLVHLDCGAAATELDIPTLSWYKRPRKLIWQGYSKVTSESWDSSKYSISGTYSLVINDVRFEDSGEYRCIKEDEDGDEENVNKWVLHVLGPPHCHVRHPDSSFIQVGQNISLECNMNFSGTHFKKPRVEWRTQDENSTLGDYDPGRPQDSPNDNTVTNILDMTVTERDVNRRFLCFGSHDNWNMSLDPVPTCPIVIKAIKVGLFMDPSSWIVCLALVVLLLLIFTCSWCIHCCKKRRIKRESKKGDHAPKVIGNPAFVFGMGGPSMKDFQAQASTARLNNNNKKPETVVEPARGGPRPTTEVGNHLQDGFGAVDTPPTNLQMKDLQQGSALKHGAFGSWHGTEDHYSHNLDDQPMQASVWNTHDSNMV